MSDYIQIVCNMTLNRIIGIFSAIKNGAAWLAAPNYVFVVEILSLISNNDRA